jgi:hypothetical protein
MIWAFLYLAGVAVILIWSDHDLRSMIIVSILGFLAGLTVGVWSPNSDGSEAPHSKWWDLP